MKLRLTADARDDLGGIRQRIATIADPILAARVIDRVGTVLSTLTLFPHIGHQGHEPSTFEMVVPRLPFVVIYRIDYTDGDSEFIILRVFHFAQPRPQMESSPADSTLPGFDSDEMVRHPHKGHPRASGTLYSSR